MKIQRHSINILRGILNAAAAKKDDSEEDTDADLEDEQDIRKYKSYFHFFLMMSMIERKHDHMLNIFFLVIYFCRDLLLRNMEWNKEKGM